MKSNFSHLVLFFFCVASLLTSPSLAIRQGAFQAGGYRNLFRQLISLDYDPTIGAPPQIHSVPSQHERTGNHF
uniref:Uncharacterized protein n=1 Tax=Oryza sativa subsp. japonica TaxID=39947 RepID=Q2QQW9_ORYSJ|nr:hypothetical protein LOC_Os12g29590 [Oryza sativa Japonica Group]